jgi:hypothetical protein
VRATETSEDLFRQAYRKLAEEISPTLTTVYLVTICQTRLITNTTSGNEKTRSQQQDILVSENGCILSDVSYSSDYNTCLKDASMSGGYLKINMRNEDSNHDITTIMIPLVDDYVTQLEHKGHAELISEKHAGEVTVISVSKKKMQPAPVHYITEYY